MLFNQKKIYMKRPVIKGNIKLQSMNFNDQSDSPLSNFEDPARNSSKVTIPFPSVSKVAKLGSTLEMSPPTDEMKLRHLGACNSSKVRPSSDLSALQMSKVGTKL